MNTKIINLVIDHVIDHVKGGRTGRIKQKVA